MNILVFGASIVSGKADVNGGWVSYLSAYLQKNTIDKKGKDSIDVYNLAINGDTSKGLHERIETDIEPRISENGTTVVVSIGLNDSQYSKEKKKNRNSVGEYRTILEGIIEKVRELDCDVIFVGLTPVDEGKLDPIPWRVEGDISYLESEVVKYDKAMKGVAEEKKIKFVGLMNGLGKDYIETLGDGIHPNAEGHKMIFELLKDKIK